MPGRWQSWLAAGLVLAPALAVAGDPERGKAVYAQNCERCHGEKGDGLGPEGRYLDPAPRDFTRGNFIFDTNGDGVPGDDADLHDFVLYGSAAFGGDPVMPGFDLSEQEIGDLIAYLRRFHP